jgi:D-glycero-D-manno-heptose 1,7-bisphosphate phosphatase
MGKIAVFLDRDGVLNKKPAIHDYVKNFNEFHWNDGARSLIQKIKEKGYLTVVVSNQQGITLGKMTDTFVKNLHKKMNEDLKTHNTNIDAFYVCPHSEGDNCECRKPKPGLFLLASKELSIDLNSSFMIGDRDSDREAAKRAGCMKTIMISSDIVNLPYIMSEIEKLK